MSEDIVVVGGGSGESDSAFDKLVQKLGGNALEEMYDRMTWVEYLFDVSASMSHPIGKYSRTGRYEWDQKTLALARKKLEEAIDDGDLSDNDYDLEDEESVKQAILNAAIAVNLPPLKLDADVRSVTKLELVKKCARKFLEKRYTKFPDARVGVITFDDYPTEVVVGQDKDTTIQALDTALEMTGGGTGIHTALESALRKVRKARGAAHHFILVTDGAPTDVRGERAFHDLIPLCKERNVVVDVIFIFDDPSKGKDSAEVQALRALVEVTGGTVEYVNNEQDMEQKFLRVSERKLLGAGGGAE